MIYLDYASSTPVSGEAQKAMEPFFAERFGNASAIHAQGQTASRALGASREGVAKALGADFREIVFTSSATEANNLALRGVIAGSKHQISSTTKLKIIVSAIEHESVLETARALERSGEGELVELPVDKNGVVDLKKLEAELDERTVLVSVMYGNNVTGVIQPITEIAKIIEGHKKTLNSQLSTFNYPLFHTDAVQCFQYLECHPKELGVDMMTLSSHKIYGPKGVGSLYVREELKKCLTPLIIGGGQEFGLRSGTENIPAIVGFAKATEEAEKNRSAEKKKVEKLRNMLWEEIKKVVPNAKRNTPEGEIALPHILSVAFPDASKNLVARCSAKGVAVSSGAACSVRSAEASYVLTAMGISKELARRSIRFSLGRETTKEEIKKAAQVIKEVILP